MKHKFPMVWTHVPRSVAINQGIPDLSGQLLKTYLLVAYPIDISFTPILSPSYPSYPHKLRLTLKCNWLISYDQPSAALYQCYVKEPFVASPIAFPALAPLGIQTRLIIGTRRVPHRGDGPKSSIQSWMVHLIKKSGHPHFRKSPKLKSCNML